MSNNPNSNEISQSEVFLQSEADNWYIRNLEKLQGNSLNLTSTTLVQKTLHPFKESIESILEIGCSNAAKLEILAEFFAAKAHGVDPSKMAIEDARKRFVKKGIPFSFEVGISADLPFSENSIDLVVLGFFMYVLDREELKTTIQEVNRVLRPGGFLVVEDFDFGNSFVNDYAHHSSIKTYKEDYASFFENQFNYFLIEKHSYAHAQDFFSIDSNERVSTQILFKPIIS